MFGISRHPLPSILLTFPMNRTILPKYMHHPHGCTLKGRRSMFSFWEICLAASASGTGTQPKRYLPRLLHWHSSDPLYQTFSFAGQQSVCQDKPTRQNEGPAPQVTSINVLSLKVPPGHEGRFATSTSDSVVAVWCLNVNMELTNVYKCDMPDNLLPRAVIFAQGARNLFAFARKTGLL